MYCFGIIERCRRVPALNGSPGFSPEVRRARRRRRSIDRRQQHKIAAWIVDLPAAERQQPVLVLFGPFAEFGLQLTPPPCSHPMSPVSENTIVLIALSDWS